MLVSSKFRSLSVVTLLLLQSCAAVDQSAPHSEADADEVGWTVGQLSQAGASPEPSKDVDRAESELSAARDGSKPRCKGKSCKGKDPDEMGCTDGRTLDEITYGSFRIELRYSHACGAAWGRVTSNDREGSDCNAEFVQILGYKSRAEKDFLGSYGQQAECPGRSWTRMWSFGDYVRACSANWDSGDIQREGGKEQCTGYH